MTSSLKLDAVESDLFAYTLKERAGLLAQAEALARRTVDGILLTRAKRGEDVPQPGTEVRWTGPPTGGVDALEWDVATDATKTDSEASAP